MSALQNSDTFTSSDNFDSVGYGILMSAKAAEVLSGSIYSSHRVPEALLRELCCNGNDSHIAAGKDNIPINVTLPTASSLYLTVQDEGIGLYPKEVVSLCTVYFKSLSELVKKRTGKFGLGAKSPFAYTSIFTVKTIKDGMCWVFTAFKDSDDHPSMTLVSETKTDEPNGVTFTIPIKKKDVNEFNKVALTVFFPFSVRPNHNNPDLELALIKADKQFSDSVLLSDGDWSYHRGNFILDSDCFYRNTRFLNSNNFNSVILGGVSYPIDFNAVLESRFNPFFNANQISEIKGLVLNLDIAVEEVNMNPGREVLQYNQGTCQVLKKHIDSITQYLNTQYRKKEYELSEWDLKCYFNENIYEDSLWGLILPTNNMNTIDSATISELNNDFRIALMSTNNNSSLRADKRLYKNSFRLSQSNRYFSEITPISDLLVVVKDEAWITQAIVPEIMRIFNTRNVVFIAPKKMGLKENRSAIVSHIIDKIGCPKFISSKDLDSYKKTIKKNSLITSSVLGSDETMVFYELTEKDSYYYCSINAVEKSGGEIKEIEESMGGLGIPCHIKGKNSNNLSMKRMRLLKSMGATSIFSMTRSDFNKLNKGYKFVECNDWIGNSINSKKGKDRNDFIFLMARSTGIMCSSVRKGIERYSNLASILNENNHLSEQRKSLNNIIKFREEMSYDPDLSDFLDAYGYLVRDVISSANDVINKVQSNAHDVFNNIYHDFPMLKYIFSNINESSKSDAEDYIELVISNKKS